jgi:hypothetical protein
MHTAAEVETAGNAFLRCVVSILGRDVAAEHNSTIVFPLPIRLLELLDRSARRD